MASDDSPDLEQYKSFVSETLEPTLRALENEHTSLNNTSASCNELINLIEGFQSDAPPEALVDVGEKCIMKAVVDPGHLIVDLGVLGMRVSMTLDEAKSFVTKRIGVLDSRQVFVERKIKCVESDLGQAFELIPQLEAMSLSAAP